MDKIPDIVDAVYDDCIFDICSTGAVESVCDAGLHLATQCMAKGINVDGWREINKECCEFSIFP